MIANRFGRALVSALAPLVFALGCSDSPAGPSTGDESRMMLSASVAGTPIATLVVTISASDITTPIVTNMTVNSGLATGTLKMPPGTARTITVRAFDATGEVTHEGSKVVDAKPGNGNPAVSIPMVAKSGHVNITVQIGPVSIVLNPTTLNLTVGQSATITATITSAGGDVITDSPQWGTTNPAFATVDAAGSVTGVLAGSASIVASYGGVAAITTVTVATAETPTEYALTVTRAGTGSGVVTSTPAAIQCGATCLSNFTLNTVVTLTATPHTGSAFTGWAGACSGMGTCTVTMNQARTVTANFSPSAGFSQVQYCALQYPQNLYASMGSTTQPIYARVFHSGLTEASGANPTVQVALGYGPYLSDPRASANWTYMMATYSSQVGNDDEYRGFITASFPGSYSFVYRVSLNNGSTWTYCDLDGSGTTGGLFSLSMMGTLDVSIFGAAK